MSPSELRTLQRRRKSRRRGPVRTKNNDSSREARFSERSSSFRIVMPRSFAILSRSPSSLQSYDRETVGDCPWHDRPAPTNPAGFTRRKLSNEPMHRTSLCYLGTMALHLRSAPPCYPFPLNPPRSFCRLDKRCLPPPWILGGQDRENFDWFLFVFWWQVCG